MPGGLARAALLGAQTEISALMFGCSDISLEFNNTCLRCFRLGAFLGHSDTVYLISKVSFFLRFATLKVRRTQPNILQLNFNSIKKFGNNTK